MMLIVLLCVLSFFFFCKQKTAYELRISDWSSDVCSSDLPRRIGDEKIVAHKLHLAADPVGEQLPAFEIILGHAVLDRHDRIAVAKLGEIFCHFGRSESPALARHQIGSAHV